MNTFSSAYCLKVFELGQTLNFRQSCVLSFFTFYDQTKYFILHNSNFSSSSKIPDTLEISAEEEQKIAKFDEEKKKQRQKKFEKKEAPKNGVPKSIPPPVIRYGAPPPGMPPGIPPQMPPMAGIPPQVIY